MNIIIDRITGVGGCTNQIKVKFVNYDPDALRSFRQIFRYFSVDEVGCDFITLSCNFKRESFATVVLENLFEFTSRCSKVCEAHESFSPRNFSESEKNLIDSQMAAIARRYESLSVESGDISKEIRSYAATSAMRDQVLSDLGEIEERLGRVRAKVFCLSLDQGGSDTSKETGSVTGVSEAKTL